MTIAAIDGDLIAFKCAAANEVRSIKALHIPSGRSKVFKHRTELKEIIGDKFPYTDFEITDIQEADQIAYALYSAKHMIKNITEKCGADKYEIYFSGKDNFRDRLALPTRYKGNREGLMRPLQLREVKEYLTEQHGAITVRMEADDMLSRRQWEGLQGSEKIIGCSTDKDSYGTDGWIFNWDKMDKPFLVQGVGKLWEKDGKIWGVGYKWKALQWICGDSIDGLKPTYLAGVKYGEKSAYKALKDLETEEQVNKVVHDIYLKWYPENKQFVDQCGIERDLNYIQIAQVYMDGIHMERWEGDRLNVEEMWRDYASS